MIGEFVNSDPRLLPEGLKIRRVKLETSLEIDAQRLNLQCCIYYQGANLLIQKYLNHQIV
jgi:hypothetical protein